MVVKPHILIVVGGVGSGGHQRQRPPPEVLSSRIDGAKDLHEAAHIHQWNVDLVVLDAVIEDLVHWTNRHCLTGCETSTLSSKSVDDCPCGGLIDRGVVVAWHPSKLLMSKT